MMAVAFHRLPQAGKSVADGQGLSMLCRERGGGIPFAGRLSELLQQGAGVLGQRHGGIQHQPIRAAELIGKSYGATNEAIRQLARAGIVREVAVDGRERIFVCGQSAAMITDFVESLVKKGDEAESSGVRC